MVEVVGRPCRQTRRHWFSVVGRGLGGWLYVMSAGWIASWLAGGQRQQDGESQMSKVREGTNSGAPTAHAVAAGGVTFTFTNSQPTVTVTRGRQRVWV